MSTSEIQVDFRRYASAGNLKAVNEMISNGIVPPRGALSLAATNGHIEMVKLLLKSMAYSKGELDEMATSVCDAVRGKHEKIVQYLLEQGASPNAGVGRFLHIPALVLSAEMGLTQLVKIFLARGANPDAHDIPAGGDLLGINVNRTALMVAAEKGRTEIVRLLLEAGADSAIKGIKGKTAYELIAKRKDRQDIAKLLLSWEEKGSAKFSSKAIEKPSIPKTASNWKGALVVLGEFCGAKATQHRQNKKIQVFTLDAKCVKEFVKGKFESETLSARDYNEALMLVKEKCVSVDASIFLSYDEGVAQLCVVPWKDKFKTVAVLKTGSVNYGVDTKELIAVLKKVDALCPFDLCECGKDSVAGSFSASVKHVKKLAAMLVDLCPFVLEEHSGKLVRFEKYLSKERCFKLRWD